MEGESRGGGSRHARRVIIRCPTTGHPVRTGLNMREDAFDMRELVNKTFHCPDCGEAHTWSRADAWLEDDPTRPLGLRFGLRSRWHYRRLPGALTSFGHNPPRPPSARSSRTADAARGPQIAAW